MTLILGCRPNTPPPAPTPNTQGESSSSSPSPETEAVPAPSPDDAEAIPPLVSGTASLRLVSLSPAITRTLVDFELGPQIVGRSPYCTFLEPSVPVAGDLTAVDYETIIKLRPTHVFVQPPATGIDPELPRIADEHHWRLVQWRLNALADIEQMIAAVPEALRIGDQPIDEGLRARARLLRLRLEDVLVHDEAVEQAGSILIVFRTSPVMAFGRKTYLDDILTRLGGRNALAMDGYPELNLEDVFKLNPDTLLLIRGDGASLDHAAALGPLATLTIKAVTEGRIVQIDDSDALMPSTQAAEIAALLRERFQRLADESP